MYIIVENSVVDRLQMGDVVVQTRYFRNYDDALAVYKNMNHVQLFLLVPDQLSDNQYEPPEPPPAVEIEEPPVVVEESPVVVEDILPPPPPAAAPSEGWSIERDGESGNVAEDAD